MDNLDFQEDLSELVTEYVKVLPDKLAEIEIEWYKLLHEPWNKERALKIHRELLNMVGSGGTLGLHLLSNVARDFASFMAGLVTADTKPVSEEEMLVDKFLQELRSAIEKNQLNKKFEKTVVTRKFIQELNSKRIEAEENMEKLQTKLKELEKRIENTVNISSQSQFLEGTVLPGSAGESYTIQQIFGNGGMGITYQAVRNSDGIRVVLKTLFPELVNDTKVSMRFLQEARAIMELDHPNLVHGYDFYQEKNLCYLVMEFIEGESVGSILKSSSSLELKKATQIILDVAMGLLYLEEKKLVHRDIKPENIILSTKGIAKLVDFGLVKMTDRDCTLTTAGIVLGTPHYLSPEQLCESKVDIRSDIYSLGATYYHMVIGEEPFQGENQMQVLQKRLVQIPKPKKVKPDLPKEVANLIEKMMQINVNKRHKNAQQLIEDLQKTLEKLAKESTNE
ncbi:MAG: serine/threonine protein kinase [Candidatus Brocadiae bacterium]|nr:serine/threonine protein kinase [Candidatus Brocadiia bacterium]